MARNEYGALAQILTDNEKEILAEWLESQKKASPGQTGRIRDAELQTQCKAFLENFRNALSKGGVNFSHPAYEPLKSQLEGISRSRALQGLSPAETAAFVFSLKQPFFSHAINIRGANSQEIAAAAWPVSLILDELGLYTVEIYQKSREEVIIRQQKEIAELSTPVVKLWEGVLALPLIGTLDSERTQVVMENLLQALVDEEAEIAIIDISGVPTVDTLTAQHLIKTVSAARLMGADCIISGIRPQIAQTMVHLGVELNVISKASLASALQVALARMGRSVVATKSAGGLKS